MASQDMMQVEIVLTKADQKIVSKLGRLPHDIENLHSTMDAIGKAMAKFGETNIEDEGRLTGELWKPLSLKYRNWKLKHFGTTHLLFKTGDLKKGFAWNAFNNKVEIGNNVPYFVYNQKGTSRGLPPRPVLGFNDDIKEQIRNRIRKDIQEKLRLANL